MNKKIKFLAPVLCGALLSSSLALTNVHAAPVNKNVKLNISMRSILPNQKLSTYCTINASAARELDKYVEKNKIDNTVTSDGIRNVLIKNGVNRQIANTVSYTLYSLAAKKETVYSFSELYQFEYGLSFLTTGDGRYSIISNSFNVDDIKSQTYSIYAFLNYEDLADIKSSMDSLICGNRNYAEVLAEDFIKNNIFQEYDVAFNVARAIGRISTPALQELIDSRDPLMIIKNEGPVEDCYRYKFTRMPR